MAYVDVSGLAGITLLAGIDPVTRDFYLSAATMNTEIHPMDIYKEMRICRRLNQNLRGFELFLSGNGKEPKGTGKFTERFVKQLLGTRFIPYDSSHELTITGTVITDDGQEGIACFDRSGLTITTIVDINYVPPQVEVIEVATGSGVLPSDVTAIGAQAASDVMSKVMEGSISFGDMIRTMSAVQWGDMTPLGGGVFEFTSISGSKVRVRGTIGVDGSRSLTLMDGS